MLEQRADDAEARAAALCVELDASKGKADSAASDNRAVQMLEDRVKSLERQNGVMLLMLTGQQGAARDSRRLQGVAGCRCASGKPSPAQPQPHLA